MNTGPPPLSVHLSLNILSGSLRYYLHTSPDPKVTLSSGRQKGGSRSDGWGWGVKGGSQRQRSTFELPCFQKLESTRSCHSVLPTYPFFRFSSPFWVSRFPESVTTPGTVGGAPVHSHPRPPIRSGFYLLRLRPRCEFRCVCSLWVCL